MAQSILSPTFSVPAPSTISWLIGARSTATRSPIELREVGERAAELAGEGIEQRLGLLLVRAVVDVDELAPVALEHVARDVDDADERQAAHVDAADRALVEVVGDDGLAGALIGILSDPARTQRVARADLEQRALQLVARTGRGRPGVGKGHVLSLLRTMMSETANEIELWIQLPILSRDDRQRKKSRNRDQSLRSGRGCSTAGPARRGAVVGWIAWPGP